jgi:hypothetical protein
VARRRQGRQLKPGGIPDAVLLDSEALSAGAQGNVRVRAELTVAEQLGARVHVSSVTLAEVLRGQRRDARVHSLMAVVDKPLCRSVAHPASGVSGVKRRPVEV